MVGRILVPDLRAFNANGDPISGALLYPCVTESLTPQVTYTTADADVEHEHPVEADSAGRFPDIWAPFDAPYRIQVTDASGAVINDTDPVFAQGASTNPAPGVIVVPSVLQPGDVNTRFEVSAGPVTMPLGANLPAGWRVRLIGRSPTTVTISYSGADTGDISALNFGDIYDAVWTGTSFEFDYVGGGLGRKMIPVPAAAMTPATTNGAAYIATETTTNKVMVRSFDFDASTKEYAQFAIPMPEGWDEGAITFEPVWAHPSTTTNFGAVWSLQALALSNDEPLDAAWGTAQTSTDTGGTTLSQYIGPESAAITVAGSPAPGDTVFFRIAREVSDGADTLAVDAKLLAIRLYVNVSAATDH